VNGEEFRKIGEAWERMRRILWSAMRPQVKFELKAL
jgi:hypothetical protein